MYGINFNSDGEMFFTDNEGGGNPKEELNRLVVNDYYGHNPSKYSFTSIHEADFILQTEVAPSGIEFNAANNDFGGTGGDLFVAYYGPGERWLRGGIGLIKIEKQADGSFSYKEFPVADIPKISDIAFGKDGSLYLAHHGKADYWYNTIYSNQGAFYKLVYDSTLINRPINSRVVADNSFSDAAVDRGKQLFAERACLGCHSVDGDTELLGPNLKDVGRRLSRNEILEEILNPSERIKPSMIAQRIYKKDGKTLLGRVIHADEENISLMLIGNHVVRISRDEILKTENEKKSLMYEGLLNRLSDEEVNSILDYLVSMAN